MASERSLDWRLVVAMYAIVAAAFVVRTLYNAETIPLIADTDDAMRLVVVRDLLAGQAWYDPLQHRMNAPYGAEMHWSRLADLPLAGMLLVLRPLLGVPMAEAVAAYALPLIWLLALLVLCARLTIRLVGSDGLLPALALPAFSLSVLGEFAPGRLDHHSLQILLLLAMTWCAIESIGRPRFAIGAGLSAALSLALGVEGIPSVAAAALAFGLVWVMRAETASALRAFGISFGLATPALMMLTLAPSRWLVPACDAISLVYATAAVATGSAFMLLSILQAGRSPLIRLMIGIGTGAVVLGGLAIAFPPCLGGPYGQLDPWLIENWIDKITEALPIWLAIANDPVYPLAVSIPPLIAVVVAGYRLARTRGDEQIAWLTYLVFLAVAVLVMVIQIRASRMVTSLAVPAGAWLIIAARGRYLERRSLPRVGGLLLSWIGSAGIAVAVVVLGIQALLSGPPSDTSAVADAGVSDRRRCIMPEAYRALAAIPPERIMAPIDLGSHLLAFTPHHVVAAPYHRNQAGVLDAFAFFNGPIEEGRAVLDERGVSLVVTCDALPEMRGRVDAAEDSFVRLLSRDALPDWLVETSASGGALRVFAVLPR